MPCCAAVGPAIHRSHGPGLATVGLGLQPDQSYDGVIRGEVRRRNRQMTRNSARDTQTRVPIRTRRPLAAALVAALVLVGTGTASAGSSTHARSGAATITPIKHVVVIFQE